MLRMQILVLEHCAFATVHDLAFFLFVIYSDLIKNSFRFVLFFFHIGEDVKY